MLVVQKYGGSSLADSHRVRAAARRIAHCAQEGMQVIVVVSAQADTTDHLIANAQSVNPKGSLREMDAYLSAGEQLSAALMAMALEDLGCKAVSLTGWQAGIETDGVPMMLFYLCSNAIWAFFSSCLVNNANTFTANAYVFGKVYFPRLTTPISNVLS